jgi:hypothetical protein
MNIWYRIRFPLMLLGMIALIAGLWTGILRLGWNVPEIKPGLLLFHGPLMICGFLGTVIGLERAVALDRPWGYLAPLLTGVGSVVTILTTQYALGRNLITAGSLVFAVIFIEILKKQLAPFTVTMALGALSWFVGNIFWLTGSPVPAVVPWWAGFLILTIGGERLDLSRLLAPPSQAYIVFFSAIAIFIAGIVLRPYYPAGGTELFGIGMLALTGWLVMHDIATKTVKQQGLTRFVAVCLLTGYFWLGISGLFTFFGGELTAGSPMYDAALHSLFLGFVFVMIFGHAPIIFPAVLQIPVLYTPLFYVHLALLEISLAVRIFGDLTGTPEAVKVGGLLNVASLLLFLLNTVVGGVRGKLSQRA